MGFLELTSVTVVLLLLPADMRAMMTFLIEAQEPTSAARAAAMSMLRYSWSAQAQHRQHLEPEPIQHVADAPVLAGAVAES